MSASDGPREVVVGDRASDTYLVKPSGSRRPETHAGLVAAGFTPKPKLGEHDHSWYYARVDDTDALAPRHTFLQRDARPNSRRSAAV